MSENTLRVDIKYGDISASFAGKPDEVLTAIIKFLSDNLPAIDLAKKISLSYDLQDLIQMFSDYIKITNEGPRIVADNNLSIKQKITLQLVGNKIAFLMNRIQSEPMSVQDLINVLGLPGKSISSRLSELVTAGYVARVGDQKTTKYVITTLGIRWLSDTLTGKIRAD